MSRNSKLPAPSASSAASATSSLTQHEREFHKAVQPGSPISALLSLARQPLHGWACRWCHHSWWANAAVQVTGCKEGGRLRNHPQMSIKLGAELQSQKPESCRWCLRRRYASSPFEDTENVPISASEPAQGERRVRLRTREALPAVGSSSSGATVSTLTSGPPKVNGFEIFAGQHLARCTCFNW
jgi:hypothetical protein